MQRTGRGWGRSRGASRGPVGPGRRRLGQQGADGNRAILGVADASCMGRLEQIGPDSTWYGPLVPHQTRLQ